MIYRKYYVNNTGKLYGMKMNAKKTKTMVVTRKDETPEINIEIDGYKIEQVNNFNYLGQTITDDGRCEKAIIKRIEIARNAFNSFGKTLTSRNISDTTKLRIIKCYIWAILLYGSETWTNRTNYQEITSF